MRSNGVAFLIFILNFFGDQYFCNADTHRSDEGILVVYSPLQPGRGVRVPLELNNEVDTVRVSFESCKKSTPEYNKGAGWTLRSLPESTQQFLHFRRLFYKASRLEPLKHLYCTADRYSAVRVTCSCVIDYQLRG